MERLITKWQKSVNEKKSIVCAGLDPAIYALGRGEQGLAKGIDLVKWGQSYLKAVADYVAGVKINPSYFESSAQIQDLIGFAKELGLVVLYDSKIADITDTNEAAIFFAAQRGVDAITVAPFAGNLMATTKLAHKMKIGTLAICIMSTLEYEVEKNMLVHISQEDAAELASLKFAVSHSRQRLSVQMVPSAWLEDKKIPRYAYLALKIRMSGTDGAVVGLSSSLRKEELLMVSTILGNKSLILTPGVGYQGGDSRFLGELIDPRRIIINSGRALMYPMGLKSSAKDQRAAAKKVNHTIWNYFLRQINL
ncbi:MAG: orotidine 5'-phosphate decarboxylase [SAR324 cluster bacterium]|nr:orotidine 5'-phosphate decarboxylase [SAR324 cluster bacterium]